ncbi:MAG: hypothetical protein JSS02_35505 [Planctomycetes bacterium]|nr:hypothetical protein [Planctomycetota bacterium]
MQPLQPEIYTASVMLMLPAQIRRLQEPLGWILSIAFLIATVGVPVSNRAPGKLARQFTGAPTTPSHSVPTVDPTATESGPRNSQPKSQQSGIIAFLVSMVSAIDAPSDRVPVAECRVPLESHPADSFPMVFLTIELPPPRFSDC